MFQPNNEKQNLTHSTPPSAPPPAQFGMFNQAVHENQIASRAPPPSYEESQQIGATGGVGLQQHWPPAYGVPAQQPMPPQYQYQQPGMQNMSGTYTNAYQQYPQYQPPMPQQLYQQQYYSGAAPMMNANNFQTAGGVPVLELHKGAEIRSSVNGAVNIPPPPPGCAPTPAQLAALQGQTVLVKTKKNSFF